MSSNKVNFNFNTATEKVKNYGDHTKNKEKIIEKKLGLVSHSFKAHPRVWVSVGLLLTCLVLLMFLLHNIITTSEAKIKVLGEKIIQLEKQEPNLAKSIFTGNQFTLQFPKAPPTGFFGKNEKYTNLGYFPNRMGQSTKYIYKNQKANQDLLTGIEVISTEIDARYGFAELRTKFALETKSKETGEVIKTTAGLELIRFAGENSQIVYYLTKTTQNYYVVKIYNQNQNEANLNDKTEFIATILNYLYLN